MHREQRPQPRIAPHCAYARGRHAALEPADRHARRLGIQGHVECRWRTKRERGTDLREPLAYGALVAGPLIDLASSAGRLALPGAPLSTIAA
jgi:hypothetical protein